MRSQSKTVRLGLSIAAALVLILVVIFGIRALTIKPVYIAVVTIQSGLYADDGLAVENGAKLYVDQINRQGGVNGHTVKIKTFYDEGDVATAVKIAHQIASDPDIVAVIGHLFSSTSKAAGEVYQQMGVTAITGTASATSLKDNQWYFSIVPGNDTVGPFLANYANRFFQSPQNTNVTIVYDRNDPYSSSLVDGFVPPFKGLSGKVHQTYDLNAQNATAMINKIVSDVLSNKPEDTGLIFVASQKNEAQTLITELRRKGVQSPILGGDALSGESFARRFSTLPEEITQPGYFTNNIYASSPVIFDSANQDGQKFFNDYKAKYNQAPTWIAASSYDAAHVLVEAIQQTTQGNNTGTITQRRSLIHDYIGKLNSPGNAVKGGVSGNIYFDKKTRDAVKPIAVGVFSQGNFISAPTQYLPIPNIDLVSNLDQDVKDNRVLIMNGKYVRKTNIVYTGIDFNQISGLDETTSTYQMDFYIWFRYQGDVDATNIQFLNADSDVALGDPLQTKDNAVNDIHYRLYRVKGTFKSTFDFHNYPFDQQQMEMRFRHANLTRDNLVYVVDTVSIKPSVDQSVFQSGGDWHINKKESTPPFFPGSVATSSSLGDPKLIGLNPDTEYATFNVAIPIARDVLSFILRNLLPVFFTLLLTYMAYFLPAEEFGTRTGILTGSILTIAFFHLGVSSSLKVGYTVALDYAFYAFYAIIMISLLTTMAEWYLHVHKEKLEQQTEELQKKPRLKKIAIAENEALIERDQSSEKFMLQTGRIFFPASLVLLFFVYVLIYGVGVKLPSLSSFGNRSLASAAQTQTNAALANTLPSATNGKVTLTIGSWRVTDQTQMNTILAVFNNQHPNIEVKFSPAVGDQYEKILRLQLQKGIAPDLFYLSSAGGRVANPLDIIANGDVEPLTNLPGLENYNVGAINTWSPDQKTPYALPLYAVSHGIYYNVDIFNQLHLSIPQTWDDLMADAQKIQDAKYIPFANAHYPNDKQRIGDLIFTNMAPTFIGGLDGRLQYENGQRCFNDQHVIALFWAIKDISRYMPVDAETLSYYDSQQLFLKGKAAMYFGGSFEIPIFESQTPAPSFKWSVFAIPHLPGQLSYINYHIDTAIALNANAPHKAEARIFLEWLTTPEYAKLLEDNLPGLFPLNTKAPVLTDQPGNDFLALNVGRGLDVRWVLPNTSLPDGRTLMQDAALGVMRGELTPRQAADQLQNGLAQWYLPAQKCLP